MHSQPKIGGFFPMDANGNILNPCSLELIPQSIVALIDQITQAYLDREGENLHSVWLRGSTPRGFYTKDFSDLDVFALIKTPGIRWQKTNWAAQANIELKQEFGEIPEIEWAISSWYSNFYQKNPRLSFYLKTQSLLLYGEDIRLKIPSFKITDDIKMNLSWLKEDVTSFLSIEAPNKEEINAIIKLVIRSAFESIMEKEGQYTVDLYWCAEAFSRHCPAGKEPIFELLKEFEIKNNNIFYLKENIKKVIELIV